jgi:hypothetical protein
MEFFRLFAYSAKERYFVGEDFYKFFCSDTMAVQNDELYNVGCYCAMSIAQGGFGFPFFSEEVFHYFATGKCTTSGIKLEHIPTGELRSLVNRLSDSQTNEEIRDIFKDQGALELLLVTGFRRSLQSITINEKSTLITCLTDYHCLLKSKAEMDQFLMGLETLGIHQAIKDMPDTLKCFFVTDVDNMITADKFKELCQVNFNSTNDKSLAERSWNFFSQFLDKCESGAIPCKVCDVLCFFTATHNVPPIGFEYRPTIVFKNQTLATANTCSLKLTLPLQHSELTSFHDAILLSVKGHDGFGLL